MSASPPPGNRSEPTYVTWVRRVTAPFSYLALAIAVIWLIGGLVALGMGHFRTAFVSIVAGAGFCAISGYRMWYDRNVLRRRTDGPVK